MTAQLFWGSLLLGICAFIHLVMIVIWVSLLNRVGDRIGKFPPFTRHMVAIGGTFALLVLSHTIQVWIWALYTFRRGFGRHHFDSANIPRGR